MVFLPAGLKVKLRQQGVQVGTIDVLIAQLCLRHELSLLTLDADFDHVARIVPFELA